MNQHLNSHRSPENEQSPPEQRTTSFLKGTLEKLRQALPTDAPAEQEQPINPRGSTFVISGAQMQARMINVATHMHNAPSDEPTSQAAAAPAPDQLPWMLGVSEPVPNEPVTYRRLPKYSPVDDEIASQQTWTIELHSMRHNGTMLGIELIGDAIIGRASEADIDLDVEIGLETTVSRRHAMLRPTPSALYLIDLGSTNGSQCNGVPLVRDTPAALYHGDVISLGLLTLTVKIIARPHSLVL
jgi:hypothetical protein